MPATTTPAITPQTGVPNTAMAHPTMTPSNKPAITSFGIPNTPGQITWLIGCYP